MENNKEFNTNDALNSIKDRIKDVYVSLIPEEQWNEMVKKEVHNYFERTNETPYGNNNQVRVSCFAKDVQSVLSEETKKRTKEYLTENFQYLWTENGTPKCNQLVEDMIIKNGGKILADMIGSHFQQALISAGYKI